jgi:hypothetical protein
VIDAFVKVVEKLIELATYREQRDQRVFKELVTKLYEDMQIVHTDYLQMLEGLRAELVGRQPLTHVAEKLARHRIQHEALRRRLEETAQALQENKQLSKYHEFFREVSRYFSGSPAGSPARGYPGTMVSSFLLRLGSTLRSISDQELALRQWTWPSDMNDSLVHQVDEYLDHIRTCWKSLSRSFAALLNSSLS